MKVFIVLALAALACAEPPPQYLPPSGDYQTTHQDQFSPPSHTAPSATYGAPSSSSGITYAAPSNTYGAPDASPSQTYGAPSNTYGAPSNTYGAPSANSHTQAFTSAPSSTYGAPSSSFGAPSRPSSTYGAPSRSSNGFRSSGIKNGISGRKHGSGASRSQFNIPSSTYGAPQTSAQPSSVYGAPSNVYGPPSSVYGAPNGGNQGGYDDQSEPAKYEFSWEVKDPQSGNDFEHEEARDGDSAWGKYEVLLPDGRRQIVEYQADQDGYKPMIRYEGTANQGGYPRGPQGPY